MYSGTSSDSWVEIQHKIAKLQLDLISWTQTLPDELQLQSIVTADFDSRERVELAMYYYSLGMILHRPSLCETVGENQSGSLHEFNRNSARTCVHAALSLLKIMPDSPSSPQADQLLPWWILLHYVTQATAILMLELTLNCQHLHNEIDEIAEHLHKAMKYLSCMSTESPSAYRAWRTFRPLFTVILTVHSEYKQNEIMNITEQAPRPKAWTEKDEASMQKTVFIPQSWVKYVHIRLNGCENNLMINNTSSIRLSGAFMPLELKCMSFSEEGSVKESSSKDLVHRQKNIWSFTEPSKSLCRFAQL